MPDDFRLDFEPTSDSGKANRGASANKARARYVDPEDDGKDYEVEPEAAESGPSPEKPIEENIDELWQRNVEEQYGLRRGFTIREILGVTTMVAVALSVIRWLPMKIAAGMLGVAVILGLWMLAGDTPKPRMMHLAFWTILCLYMIVAMAAAAMR